MLNQQLIDPQSIVIIGGSNNLQKPGGKIVKNILDGGYQKPLRIVNPKETTVQDLPCFGSVEKIPDTELAIIAIPARFCLETIKTLAYEKNTKAFIILSAGFSEVNEAGAKLEHEVVQIIDDVNGVLIGPNCIGVLNENYHGVFTSPIPELDPKGCDFISGSGATAVFIMEAGMPLGLRFASVFSIGNSAQAGVEDVLEYMDLHFDPEKDSHIKLLYIENIRKPQKLLKHASSLIKKGCKIAAIKAGSTEAGSRAAASHTGAIASSDMAVRALFRKAGIVYCSSRQELITVASIFNYKPLKGKNIAIITHAGGSAVMLTDTLVKGGMEVPKIEGEVADKLLSYLNPGSSVSNPIDFLATGTAEQLGIIIDYCEHKLDHIDGMVVVFGSAGLFDVANVYNVLSVKLEVCEKPIYPVLPSIVNAQNEISYFLSKGNINFPDEVLLGIALAETYHVCKPMTEDETVQQINKPAIRKIMDNAQPGFLPPGEVKELLDAAGIARAREAITSDMDEAVRLAKLMHYPVALKAVGPVHKTDVGGVMLNIKNKESLKRHFQQLMNIPGTKSIMIQAMHQGFELYAGVKHEDKFGHIILCGLGGIFIEVLKDVSAGLVPLNHTEVRNMIRKLRGYPVFKGVRNMEAANEELFSELLIHLSALVEAAPEISEMDLNPVLGNEKEVVAVDTRIFIKKDNDNNNH
jgi:acyl-CoA synthetase (NDP forming)